MPRRSVNSSMIAEIRRGLPRIDQNPVMVILRTVVHPNPGGPPIVSPRTAMHDAMIAAALADCRKDGRVRRLILDTEPDG